MNKDMSINYTSFKDRLDVLVTKSPNELIKLTLKSFYKKGELTLIGKPLDFLNILGEEETQSLIVISEKIGDVFMLTEGYYHTITAMKTKYPIMKGS